ncbi:hypothetical protein [Desulforhopalus singaporensis]|uniref:Uncharacterized protein n=1 Tax=Desulforhopalus singaporensis TaxID=91360 RepID=A0A1H0TF08_9BACT|nr:hypothetical protein [Desulforhopalus singaporensis]SDP52642.1 hypothetical protein SAMN05660330_03056 [Desulforhopalus singaporensis]
MLNTFIMPTPKATGVLKSGSEIRSSISKLAAVPSTRQCSKHGQQTFETVSFQPPAQIDNEKEYQRGSGYAYKQDGNQGGSDSNTLITISVATSR